MSLDTAYQTAGSSAKSLDLSGSDGRLEIVIQPGTFDLTKATTASGVAPQGSLTLHFTQVSGHFVGWLDELGTYQLQLLDSHGNVVNGILLRTPITFIYHYQPAELNVLGIDASHLLMTWPGLMAAAQKAHTSTANLSIPLKNDPAAHTLTGQSSVLDSNIIKFGIATPTDQAPSALHLASVQGNSGQYTYSYPLQVAPGPNGFAPQLALVYSSSGPNERHSLTSPAGDMGDGWSLSLGSISVENYPDGSTYYFLNDVAGVGDRLIPTATAGFFATEHVSYLRIQQINPGTNGTCFHVWDKSGTYYELGCTNKNISNTSLQYWKDSSGNQHDYEWDVNKIIAPNEGQNAGTYRLMLVNYVQDSTTDSHGNVTIRAATMEQVTYGLSSDEGTLSVTVGTVDFHYLAPTANGSWADAYAYGTNYNCSSGTQPGGHPSNMRCDDPEQELPSGSHFAAPTVLNTLTLTSLTSYVGTDSTGYKAYRYDFVYNDTPYTTTNCIDTTGLSGYCAGEHVLTQITPSVYQYVNGQPQQHSLFATSFGYTSLQDTYSDSGQIVGGKTYHVITSWDYLTSYANSGTNEGVSITYAGAYNNAHGTPTDTNYQGGTDDRFDPFYCPNHVNSQASLQCTGLYAPYDDHAWEEQVVTQLQSKGFDASNQAPAVVSYKYGLAFTGIWGGKYSWCEPDQNGIESECVGDNWLPPTTDKDWQDYYHAEYQGFAQVLITSPAKDLTIDSYYSTDGWNTLLTNYNNFLGGVLYQEDIYQGDNANNANPLIETKDTYATDIGACTNGTPSSSPIYYSCEVALAGTTTTDFELTNNASAPTLTHNYTYDDYNGSWLTGGYHNLTQDQISGSNLQPSNASTILYPITKKWSYTYNNPSSQGNWVYYTVNKATHSEIDDHSGHIWQCQNIIYDENTGNTLPTAGWPTTTQTYTNGCNSSSVITNYNAYDQYGNALATVDGVGADLPSLYGGKGCGVILPTGAAKGVGWSQSTYTTCASYDSFFAQTTSQTDAFNFTTNLTYDPTQGSLLTSTVDPNGLTNAYTYSYDSSGNRTVQDLTSPDTTNYTNQSSTATSCTSSSTLPCFEVDTNSYLYNTVKTSTFYDAQGRAVETRTPGPGTYDTIVITTYNDQNHSVWKSNPFEVTHGSGWIDPNGVTDRLGNPVYGTATFYDALGRAIAVQDQSLGTGSDGTHCSTYLGNTYTYTSCLNYGLGQANSIPGVNDTNYELTATAVDADSHVTVSYQDALGRTTYMLNESGTYGGTLTGTKLQTLLYNALDKPTSLAVEDLATSKTITTTTGYDDLGRATNVNDPDRGNHAYTFDPDGRVIVDAVGSRTIGYVYDLLGRLGCVQDAYPSSSPTGICTGGNHLVQNTYDTNKLTVSGTTDYPKGQLTQSVALTIFPDSTSATTTELFEHDIRGQLLAEQMTIGNLPGSWNVTTALPAYQVQNTYNDANQLTQTQTSANGVTGYTTYPVYNSTNGWLNGTGKTSGAANLANYSYGVHAEVTDIDFKTSTNGSLLDDHFNYDKNLRVTSATATWQAGSGSSGNTFTQNLTYDAASNLTKLVTTQAAVPGVSNSGGSETQVFCYDEQNRLVWAGNTGTPSCTGNGTPAVSGSIAAYGNSFVYTNLGQLAQGPLAGSGNYLYLYCNSQPHELTGLYPIGTPCSNLSGAVYTSSYDSFGNVTSRTTSSVTDTMNYDKLDRMTNWSSNASGQTQQEQYVYDASGNRVLRRSTSGPSSGPTTTITTYAFGLEEHTYTSVGASTGNLYYYFLGGRLIGSFDGTNTIFYLTDALGSIVSAFSNTASTAAIKGNQLFGPYGVSGTARYLAGAINTAKGFTGQYNDALTGLDYYGARYYDPVVGVFLSADTAQSNAQGMNPYGYVNGNPETYSDPSGHYIGTSIPLSQQGGAIGYLMPDHNTIMTIVNDGGGNGYTVNGQFFRTTNGFSIDTFTEKQEAAYSGDNPNAGTSNTVGGMVQQVGSGIFAFLSNFWTNFTTPTGDVTPCGLLSFTPTTKVATSQGEKSIGSLHPGERVWAYNTKTHKMELQPIVHVWINHDNDLVDVTIASTIPAQHGKVAQKTSEVVHTNKKHPFLTLEKGFIPVSQLRVGMHVVSANGSIGTIMVLKVIPGAMTMYNLEVARDHTYTVGVGEWIVHNCGGWNERPFDDSFNGLEGASYEQIMARIPQSATERPWIPNKDGALFGQQWTWTDGTYKYILRMHGPDMNAVKNFPDSNAANGWTFRLYSSGNGEGGFYMDSSGKWHPEQETDWRNVPGGGRMVSPKGQYDPNVADGTHMPMEDPIDTYFDAFIAP
ncbi:MAG: RHS repeat-associated core domain-containing protein [Ktedonobacteraceae bacterium]